MSDSLRLQPHPLSVTLPEAEALATRLQQLCPGARLYSDARRLSAGDILVMRPGRQMGLEGLLGQALAAQAGGLVVDRLHHQAAADWLASHRQGPELPLLALSDLSVAQGVLAAAFYGQPSQSLRLTAVTGTNGKSTVVHGLARAWARLGRSAATIGTLGVIRYQAVRPGEMEPQQTTLKPPGLTSLDSVELQEVLAMLLAEGAVDVALEASSIGLEQGRLAGCWIRQAGFTNLSHEHLDHHGDLAHYAAAKALIFQAPGLTGAVLAEPLAQQATEALSRGSRPIWRAAAALPAQSCLVAMVEADGVLSMTAAQNGAMAGLGCDRLNLRSVAVDEAGLSLLLETVQGQAACRVSTWGLHNQQNLSVVAGLLLQSGLSLSDLAKGLEGFAPPEGRLERVSCERTDPHPMVVVDYAHTPDGLEQALLALRPLARARGGQLRVVFGCGGDRDRSKRPRMGAIGAALADRLIITSDNPRSESPSAILEDILTGIEPSQRSRVQLRVERGEAIDDCLDASGPQDVVLIAGKGHETQQIEAGRAREFDDRRVAAQALADWRPGFCLQDLHVILSGPDARPVGRAWVAQADRLVESVSTDSRQMRAGAIFVALVGERLNGHDFLLQAEAAGAAGLIVSAPPPADLADRIPVLQVSDTGQALGRIAAAWREAWSGQLVAVAGSNGKTTVKEMIRSVLGAAVGARSVWATPGNLNNQVGLPLSLLGLRHRHRMAVIEIGMNHPGEIDQLAKWASPSLAVMTNAQREHQEFMGSVEACARENGTLLQHLRPGGWAILPRDEAHEGIWRDQSAAHPTARFGFSATPADPNHRPALELDVSLEAQTSEGMSLRISCSHSRQQGQAQPWPPAGLEVSLQALGRHLATCAAAAATVGRVLGLSASSIGAGLADFRPMSGRGRLLALGPLQTLVDDSYNANPDSVRAAIEALSERSGLRGLILGDMGEVGAAGPAFHDEVLRLADERRIQQIWLMGEAMQAASIRLGLGRCPESLEGLARSVQDWLQDEGSHDESKTVWLKGSRFMRLERLIPLITLREGDHAALSV